VSSPSEIFRASQAAREKHRLIGQLKNSYILCESAEGLLCVDQHAAHERVLFERYKQELARNAVQSQRKLLPESFELSRAEAEILEALLPELEKAGLAIERFSGTTFVARSVPVFLAEREIRPLAIEMVEAVTQAGGIARLSRALDECLALVACHGAVRARQPLSAPEMERLLADLAECGDPSHCPHGRPTFVSFRLPEIAKLFRRL
jgi:DNA mismatch repair protein MutL